MFLSRWFQRPSLNQTLCALNSVDNAPRPLVRTCDIATSWSVDKQTGISEGDFIPTESKDAHPALMHNHESSYALRFRCVGAHTICSCCMPALLTPEYRTKLRSNAAKICGRNDDLRMMIASPVLFSWAAERDRFNSCKKHSEEVFSYRGRVCPTRVV